jgi:hypothetical protein
MGWALLALAVVLSGTCPFSLISISRMRASRASSSDVCELICCFLQQAKADQHCVCIVGWVASRLATALAGLLELTACPPAHPGRRRCFRCGRCPSALARTSGRLCCIDGDKCQSFVPSGAFPRNRGKTHDCGRRPLGFQSRSSSSSVMAAAVVCDRDKNMLCFARGRSKRCVPG